MADRRERAADATLALLAAMTEHQAQIWTALPGVVQSFDPAKATVSVRSAVKARVQSQSGSFTWVELPLLVDVPVIVPSAGGFIITLPIAQGDECLVVFSSRCLDAWWQSGGVQVQADLRLHDLSDGLALMGPRSLPRVLNDWASDALEIRSDSGDVMVRLSEDELILKAPTVKIQGNVLVEGSGLSHNGTNVGDDHTHGGVDVGVGNTGGPN